MKNLIFALVALAFISSENLFAESIFECSDGVIQNRPCKDNKGKLLNQLPALSKYNSRDVVSDADDMRARPNPKSFEEMNVPDKKEMILNELTSSAVKGRDSADLAEKSTKLKTDLASKSISIPQAESESIRLQVLHNTLCGKRAATKSVEIEQDCSKALNDIQLVASALQNYRKKF